MPSDYAKIGEAKKAEHGTSGGKVARFFANLYSDRTHFVYELLQNAEDAIRRRIEAAPAMPFNGRVKFHLFSDHLDFTHFGKPFDEDDVSAICSMLESTKEGDLTEIGEFGIGFKSVYAYTKRPEVHSGDEHFVIENCLYPKSTQPRSAETDQTRFYLPFDGEKVSIQKASAEISNRLKELGQQTLLFLKHIDSVDWEVEGGSSGSFTRKCESRKSHRLVTLSSSDNVSELEEPSDEQFLVFSKPVCTPEGKSAGQAEVAFKVVTNAESKKRSIAPAEKTCLFVFFPTEKETNLGFLVQGPFKTTPARDNIPHDNEWNTQLVEMTGKLVSDSLVQLSKLGLANGGLLESLFASWPIPQNSMFQKIYDDVVRTLRAFPLIPAVGGRLVSGGCAFIASSRGLADLLTPKQLTQLINRQLRDGETLDWVDSNLGHRATTFLKEVLSIQEIEPRTVSYFLTEDFFKRQSLGWLAEFYEFLLDKPALWCADGPLRTKPFIRLYDKRHVMPFKSDGTPNAYLPGDVTPNSGTNYVHPKLAKRCKEFLGDKLGLIVPDVTTEILESVIPDYENTENDVSEKRHHSNISKILHSLRGSSPARTALIAKLKGIAFLSAIEPHSGVRSRKKPSDIYFPIAELTTYFEPSEDVWFLDDPGNIFGEPENQELLKMLGVEDKPRRIHFSTAEDDAIKTRLRSSHSRNNELHFYQYNIHGLERFLNVLTHSNLETAATRARVLWTFLCKHVSEQRSNTEADFFFGEYAWSHYSTLNTKPFDAFFVELLRSETWLPGDDGLLHKPPELSADSLPLDFERCPMLCKVLKMAEEVDVAFAKKHQLPLDLIDQLSDPEVLEWLRRRKKNESARRDQPSDSLDAVDSVSLDEPTEAPEGTPPLNKTQSKETSRKPRPKNEASEFEDAPSVTEETRGGGSGEPRMRSSGDRSNQAQDGRFRTYPSPIIEGDDDELDGEHSGSAEEVERRKRRGRKAVQFVLEQERKAGRFAKAMSETNEGYDVESYKDEDAMTANRDVERFIEVKSTSAEWGERGVSIKAPQFRFAMKKGEKAWLYVVDMADSDEPGLYRIQDFANRVKDFPYNHDWRAFAETDILKNK